MLMTTRFGARRVPRSRSLLAWVHVPACALCLACACTALISSRALGQVRPTIRNTNSMEQAQEFKVDGRVIRIDSTELERIRAAVVKRLASRTLEADRANADAMQRFETELTQAPATVGPDDTRLGAWALAYRGDQLALVRVPPRALLNILYVAKLTRAVDGAWTVTDFYQERMAARR